MTASDAKGANLAGNQQDVEHDRSLVKEGEIDPRLGKRVDTLILRNKDVLVYLDEDHYVEWSYNEEKIPQGEGWPGIFNRVSLLEAFQIDGLSNEVRTSFRRMIGEGVARLLLSRDVGAANQILDKAEEYANARNLDLARRWYVSAAGAVCAVALVVAFITWALQGAVMAKLGGTAFDLLMTTCSGAVGASISLLLGTQNRPLDAIAGRPAHVFAGVTRVVTGMGGAALAALAVKVNVLAGFVVGTAHPFAALMLVGAVAGASERLVPDMITRIEGSLNETGSRTSDKSDSSSTVETSSTPKTKRE